MLIIWRTGQSWPALVLSTSACGVAYSLQKPFEQNIIHMGIRGPVPMMAHWSQGWKDLKKKKLDTITVFVGFVCINTRSLACTLLNIMETLCSPKTRYIDVWLKQLQITVPCSFVYRHVSGFEGSLKGMGFAEPNWIWVCKYCSDV